MISKSPIVSHALSMSAATISLICLTVWDVNAQETWWEDNVVFGSFPIATEPGVPPVETGGGTIEIANDTSFVVEQKDAVQAAGGYFLSNISVFNARNETYSVRPELVDAAVIDIYGEPLYVPWESTDTELLWWGNTNDPVWQNFLQEQLHNLVDVGVDGILLDEIEGTAGSLSRGGSFGQSDVEGFQDYLDERYTDEFLLERYGIDDVQAFDYGAYIVGNGWGESYLQQEPWIPLIEDYGNFQRTSSKDFISELIAETRQYATDTGSEQPVFTGNIFGFAPHLMLYNNDLDFLTVEYPYVEDGIAPWGHALPMLQLGRASGKKSVVFPSVFTGRSIYLWPDTKDLFSLWIMEAYATGNAFLHQERFFAGTGFGGQRNWLEPDTTHTNQIFKFIADNHFVYDKSEPMAEVAIAYSHPSDYFDNIRDSVLGTAYALSDAHIQYNIIFMGDDVQRVEDTTTLSQLKKYDAIILPSARLLTESQTSMLQNYVLSGGVLLTTAEPGTHDANNDSAYRPQWQTMTARGSRDWGDGFVQVINENFGEVYIAERSEELREILTDPVMLRSNPLVETDAADSTHFLLARDNLETGEIFYTLDLFNYNYTQYSNRIWTAEEAAVTVQLDADFANDGSYQLYRLEVSPPSIDLVTFSRSGSSASFTADPIGAHATYLFMPQAAAEALADGVEGASAQDYQDALDRAEAESRDTSEIEAIYASIDDALGAENFLEARRLEQELVVAIGLLFRSRVLFDESLEPRYTLSAERALELNSKNPERARFITLNERLVSEFALTRNVSSPITDEMLDGYEIVFLPAPTQSLEEAEITALKQFVFGGGGLILLGDGNSGWSNGVTEDFGIRLRGELISEQEGSGFGNVVLTPQSLEHPSLDEAPLEAQFNYSGTLEVEAPASTILYSSSEAWIDLDRGFDRDADEPTGPIALGAIAYHGEGRIVVLADASFSDNILAYTDNSKLMRSILLWLDSNDTGTTVTGGTSSTATAAYLEWSETSFEVDELDPEYEDTVWGSTADPDGDGNENYIEYVSGQDPVTVGVVDQTIAVDAQTETMTMSMPWASEESEQKVEVLYSPDLVGWGVEESFFGSDLIEWIDGERRIVVDLPMKEGFYRFNFPVLTVTR